MPAVRIALLLLLSGFLKAAAWAQAPAGTLPTVVSPIGVTVVATGKTLSIDLSKVFGLPNVSGTVVQFNTVLGPVNVELFSQAAPLTTANFLNYVSAGSYTNTFFNRAVTGFIAQGGTYTLQGNTLYVVASAAPVVNEYKISNTRGTLAMALVSGNPNSATNTWFFNLADNSANLNNQNGGFTVFGQVIGTGMTVVDQVGNATEVDLSGSLNADFANTPVINYNAAAGLTVSNLILIPSISVIPIYPTATSTAAVLGFSVKSDTPGAVSAAISGSTLTLTGGSPGTANITVTATDSNGNAAATTFAASSSGALAITLQPVAQTVATGSTVVFSTAVNNAIGATYQWSLNGVAITGATNARLLISGAAAPNAGNYGCTITSPLGTLTTQTAALAVSASTNPGRLGNLSVLNNFTAGQTLTVGFVTGGSGTSGVQSLLIRATGPSLAAVSGLSLTMLDPRLQVFAQGQSSPIVSNDNWGTPSSNVAVVTAADTATYAFPLLSGSLDAALVASLGSGPYTVQVNGTGPGLALTELYDDTPSGAYTPASTRLINVSCNSLIPKGGSLTAGFVVTGGTSKTVLIRATGPTLQADFAVSGTMADPQVNIYSSVGSVPLATNAGWGGDPQIAAASSSVSAFAFASTTSLDSAILITLPPGGYTAVVSSVSGGGGVALVEVYEIP